MTLVRDGIPAAPGIVIAPARVLRWEVPRVPHAATISPDRVEGEVKRFLDACAWAQGRIRELHRLYSPAAPVKCALLSTYN